MDGLLVVEGRASYSGSGSAVGFTRKVEAVRVRGMLSLHKNVQITVTIL